VNLPPQVPIRIARPPRRSTSTTYPEQPRTPRPPTTTAGTSARPVRAQAPPGTQVHGAQGRGRLEGRRPRGAAVTRTRVPVTEHARLIAALTPRDRWILRMLAEHRVLTTSMLVGLAFPSDRSAQLRLRALFQLGVVNRFQPLIPIGSAPMHWILDTPGHAVLTAEDNPLNRRALGKGERSGGERSRRAQALAIAHSAQLAHLLAVNAALTTLAATSTSAGLATVTAGRGRTADGSAESVGLTVGLTAGSTAGSTAGLTAGLTLWWSQARAARHVGDFVRPDAYAHYHHPASHPTSENSNRLAFFYEHDRGSEPSTQIAAKIARYHDLAAASAITTPVLFWLPSRAWETTVRDALAAALDALDTPGRVPIATTSPLQPGPRPNTLAAATPTPPATLAGPVWLPLTRPRMGPGQRLGQRVSLARLAQLWPHQPGRDHTTSPLATPLSARGRTAGGEPERISAGLAAPHPIPPAASPHPARR
jgi:Replication-relaxation